MVSEAVGLIFFDAWSMGFTALDCKHGCYNSETFPRHAGE